MLSDKIAVIDIGSNSVRLMISKSGKTLYKKVEVTRLSQDMSECGELSHASAERTAMAVLRFYDLAKQEKVKNVLAFATACVRNAVNGKEFIDNIYNACGLNVEIISGELEAKMGYVGALNGKDGGIIDIGGASTEVMVVAGGEKKYAKSVNVGVVKLFEKCDNDKNQTQKEVDERINEYGKIPSQDFYAIGGTATSLAAISQALSPYDPNKVHGYKLTASELERLTDNLFDLSVEEKRNLKGLQPQRAEVIAGGALLLLNLMKKIGIEYITVSESDNLEGYLRLKTEMA